MHPAHDIPSLNTAHYTPVPLPFYAACFDNVALADPIIEALDNTGAELPDRADYEKDYKVQHVAIHRSLQTATVRCAKQFSSVT